VDHETRKSLDKRGWVVEVWRHIWPDKGDGRGWWEAWESWPLELGLGGGISSVHTKRIRSDSCEAKVVRSVAELLDALPGATCVTV